MDDVCKLRCDLMQLAGVDRPERRDASLGRVVECVVGRGHAREQRVAAETSFMATGAMNFTRGEVGNQISIKLLKANLREHPNEYVRSTHRLHPR